MLAMKTKSAPAGPRMLTRGEAAEFLSVSQATMARWAAERTGPPFVKLAGGNGSVRYPTDLLQEFVAARLKNPK